MQDLAEVQKGALRNNTRYSEQKIEEMIKDFQEKYGKKALFRKNDEK